MRRLLLVPVVAALMLMTAVTPAFAQGGYFSQDHSIAGDVTMGGGPSGGGYGGGPYLGGGYPQIYPMGYPQINPTGYFSSEDAWDNYVDYVENVNGW